LPGKERIKGMEEKGHCRKGNISTCNGLKGLAKNPSIKCRREDTEKKKPKEGEGGEKNTDRLPRKTSKGAVCPAAKAIDDVKREKGREDEERVRQFQKLSGRVEKKKGKRIVRVQTLGSPRFKKKGEAQNREALGGKRELPQR